MRKLLLLALFAGLFVTPALADFTAKDAALATMTFKNPNTCTSVVCTPIFAQYDSTGTNAVAVLTVGADGASNTANGALEYTRNLVFNGTTWDRWYGDATNGGFVNVKTSVLPTGAATSAAQTTAQTSLSSIVTNTTGGSTSANQTSELTKLDTIITNTSAAIPAGTSRIGYVTDDPCSGAATKVYTPINIVTAASTVVSTGVAAKKKYICALMLYPGATDNVAIIQATTATACATAPVGLIGGATAATGIIATAQAGFVIGTGANAVAATTVNQTDICLITSAAVQLSGVLVTVDQ